MGILALLYEILAFEVLTEFILSLLYFQSTISFYNFSIKDWITITRMLGSPIVWDGVCCCDMRRRSSYVTIIQTHCVQYSGVLVNIRDDTVTEARGESHDINIRMLQHHNDQSHWVLWRHTSIGNFYRIDINSLHFSNHYSLCERQFSFIW